MRVVKFHDGFEVEVEDYEERAITDAMAKGAKFVQIQGSVIAVASVARITDGYGGQDEFKPEPREEYVSLDSLAARNEKNSASLLEGLKKYCDENPGAKKARAMYDEKLQAHVRRYSMPA